MLDELKKGADFAKLAKKNQPTLSLPATAVIWGWLEDAATVPELKEAGLKKKGQLSGVIKSSVGFLVARLDDVQAAQVKPLAEVRDDVRRK